MASEPDALGADTFVAVRALFRQCLSGVSRLAVAFSGGVDSAALLHLAIDEVGGENVLALHARSLLFPEGRHRRLCDRMLADFSRLCRVRVVPFAPLEIAGFAENPPERCYLCKKRLYEQFLRMARDEGATVLADGVNADDEVNERPGWRAIQELAVMTPLREAGMGKAVIRAYARRHGLANHDLPSQSCLATRFAPNFMIDEARLRLVARLESRIGEFLPDFRLRLSEDGWGIEIRGAEAGNPALIDEAAIRRCFQEHGLELAPLTIPHSGKNSFIEEKI
jgi:uncharacterized protein